jgi:hypothetical protein
VRSPPRIASSLLVLACAACGYHALYGGETDGKLHVVLVRTAVASASASDEVVSGARDELAREGALAPGDGFPRLEIEVLRLDEATDAVAVGRDGTGAKVPSARGTEVGVVARAWIVTARGAEPTRDTGDVRALNVVGTDDPATALTGSAARRDAFRHEDALRAAARRVGERLARRVLGHPVAVDESTGRER